MFKFFSLFCFLFINMAFSQAEKLMNGKIIVPDAMVDHVLVLNLNNAAETFTDSEGKFSISAKIGDVLIFHATHLDKMRKLIDDEAYNNSVVNILMTSKIVELEEVTIIDYSNLNAYKLGILEKPAIVLSPAQRGKYGSDRRAIEFEENLSIIEKLENLYDNDFLEKRLLIKRGMTKSLFKNIE